MALRNFSRTLLDFFTSQKLAIALFALFSGLLIPSTLSPRLATALAIPIRIMMAMLFLTLALCTFRRLKLLRTSTLFIHLGSIVAIVGFLISSFGFVATVNIYEGTTTDKVFRWDVMADKSLGYDLYVAKINREYYPIPVKVGILKNGRKAALFETWTGNSFVFGDYLVKVESLNPVSRVLNLDVRSRTGKEIGTFSTSGISHLPADVPLDFRLVAFKNPDLKQVWIDLELLKNGKVIAAGSSAVNHPFVWQGVRFFNTQVASDPAGRDYAGLQIRKDPGIPYVYAGFGILFLGLLLALYRWCRTGWGRRA